MSDFGIYVGTYHKYNCGSIAGKWLDPSLYADKKAFLEACHELHKDEDDPELMFQDNDSIPDKFISESHVDDELWDYFDVLGTTHLNRDIIEAGLELGIDLHNIEDRYVGEFNTEKDFGYYIAETMEIPPHLEFYIDYEAIGRDYSVDYLTEDTYYFYSR